MSVVHLVRHGQASFGAREYDKLSRLGVRQSTVLGEALKAHGVTPDLVLVGNHVRHHDSAAACLAALGVTPTPEVDHGWDEFDHADVIERHRPAYRSKVVMGLDLVRTGSPGTAFQAMFDEALARWVAADTGYHETWAAFSERVGAAVDRLTARLERSRTALVFTSGGPVSAAAATLLGGGSDLWLRLNRVTVNTGVTKLVTGRRGTTLVTFNEHGHLDRDTLSYR